MNELIFDLETSAAIAYVWSAYKIDSVIEIIEESKIISVAWKRVGEKRVYSMALPDFPGYKPGIVDDKHITTFVWELINKADIAIAHNGKQFDMKVAYGRMFVHGLTPPREPLLVADTKAEASSRFRLMKNNLEYISTLTGGAPKVEHEGFGLWKKCRAGDMQAWERMKRYNRRDVAILEPIYIRMKPWMAKKFPNINLVNGTAMACRVPGCGGTSFNKDGWGYNGVSRYQKLRCKRCGAPNRRGPEILPLKERPLIR